MAELSTVRKREPRLWVWESRFWAKVASIGLKYRWIPKRFTIWAMERTVSIWIRLEEFNDALMRREG
jgi:hypothetical protein